MSKYIITGIGKGTYGAGNSEITEDNLFEVGSEGITATNISNWNTAFNWGDHADVGYLTSVTWGDIINKPSLDNYQGWKFFTNGFERSTIGSNDAFNISAGNNITLALDSDSKGVTINANIPDAYEGWDLGINGDTPVRIRERDDVQFIGGTNMTITRSGNNLTFDAAGGTGADGNNYVNSVQFNTGNGILTLGRNGLGDITRDLDGRYALETNVVPKSGGTFSGNIYAPKFYQSSLRSLKTNIESYKGNALSLIDALEFVEFDYKTGESDNIGIIADDSPKEFLSTEGDAVNLYNTSFLTAKAVQELNYKVKSQQKEIEQLKAKVEQLMTKL